MACGRSSGGSCCTFAITCPIAATRAAASTGPLIACPGGYFAANSRCSVRISVMRGSSPLPLNHQTAHAATSARASVSPSKVLRLVVRCGICCSPSGMKIVLWEMHGSPAKGGSSRGLVAWTRGFPSDYTLRYAETTCAETTCANKR